MGRYTLTYETFDRQKVDIKFTKDGKEVTKVSLNEIDKLTTKSPSATDLVKRLNAKGVKNIEIKYIYDKKEKVLPVAYDDKTELMQVKMKDDSNISMSDTKFISIMVKFINLLNNKIFFKMVMNSDTINDKQKEYIERRIIDNDWSPNCVNKIIEHSSGYKQFRAIVFLMKAYMEGNCFKANEEKRNYLEPEQPVVISNDEEDSADSYDLDEEIFLSEEEKEEMYNYKHKK